MAKIGKAALWIGSAAVAAAVTTSVAHAGAFAIREQSACGQGASFAGVAAGCSLSSMFWNPATLMATEGVEIEMVGTGIFPKADVSVDAPVRIRRGRHRAGCIRSGELCRRGGSTTASSSEWASTARSAS